MLLGPFFVAELTTAARRRRYYYLRALYAGCLLFLLWVNYPWWYSANTVSSVAMFARRFFYSFAVLQYVAIFVVLPAMVAGAIAQERERRTIEYLLTSHLTARDIILGKLGSRIVQAVALLMTGFGILATALLLGGVSSRDLLWALGGAAVLLVELGGVSMLISTWSRRSRDALKNIYVFLFVWSIGPVCLVSLIGALTENPYWYHFFSIAWLTSPWAICMIGAFDYATSVSVNPYFWVVTGHLGFGLFCVLASILTLRRAYDRADIVPPVETERKSRRLFGGERSGKQKRKGKGAPQTCWRLAMIERHPMRWKEIYPRPRRRLMTFLLWVAAIGTLIGPVLAAFNSAGTEELGRVVQVTSTVLLSCSLLLIAARAAASVTTEKERDSWATLLSTTLPANEIVLGKVWGAIHEARWLLGISTVSWLAATLFNPAMFIAFLLQLIAYAPCCLFCAGLGVRFSLRSNTSIAAMGKTIVALLTINLGYLLIIMPFLAALGADDSPWWLAPCSPFLIGYAPEIVFALQEEYYQYQGSWFSELAVTMMIGVIGYSIAAAVTLAGCIGRFDVWTDRTRPKGIIEFPPRANLARPPAPSV